MGGLGEWGYGKVSGRLGAGLCGFALMQACFGQSPVLFHDPPYPEGAGAPSGGVGGTAMQPPASAGESTGGAESASGAGAGAENAAGAAAGGDASAGAAGAGPEPQRSITARFIDEALQPVPDVKLYIAGRKFVSGADGVAHAEGPLGTYDALFNDDVPFTDSDIAFDAGIHLYQDLTTDQPLFRLSRRYGSDIVPFGRSRASGKLTGDYPADAKAGFYFASPSPLLESSGGSMGSGSYDAAMNWYRADVSASGNLNVLLSHGENSESKAFWFGQAQIATTTSTPVVQDIAVAPVATRQVSVALDVADGYTVQAAFWFGPLLNDGFRTDAEITATPYTLPSLPDGSMPTIFEVFETPVTLPTEQSGVSWVEVPTSATSVQLSVPPLPNLTEPAAGAKKVSATTTFGVDELPNTCKLFAISAGPGTDVSYTVTVHTARSSLTPPDLRVLGSYWPKGANGSWAVGVNGPCSRTDDLVKPLPLKMVTPAQTFNMSRRKFTTAK